MRSMRNRSMWDTGTGPGYCCPIVKMGLVTGTVTPSSLHAPRTSVVFPAPSSPATSTTSPGRSVAASRAPIASVSAGPAVSTWSTAAGVVSGDSEISLRKVMPWTLGGTAQWALGGTAQWTLGGTAQWALGGTG